MKKLFLSLILVTGTWSLVTLTARAQTTPTIAISPSAQTIDVDQHTTVTIALTDIVNLGAYQATLNFDPTLVQITGATHSSFLASTGRSASPLPSAINNSTGTLIFGAYSFGSPDGPNGSGDLITISLSGQEIGEANLTLSNVILTQPEGSLIPVSAETASITISQPGVSPTPPDGGSPTPTPTPTPQAVLSAALSFIAPQSASVSAAFDVSLWLNTSGPITGVDAFVTFDPDLLQVQSLTDDHLLPATPVIDYDNTLGTIRVSQVTDPGNPFQGQGSLATVSVQALTAGQAEIAYQYTAGSKTDSNVIDAQSGQDVLTAPEPLAITLENPADLVISLTTPSEDITLGHSVQGTVTVQSGPFQSPFSTNPQGTSNAVRLSQGLIASLQTFYVKVTGFLKKAVTLSPAPGFNLADFGLLKAGDLDDNGIVNSLDLSLMYGNWFNTGLGDFNQDGVVNSADHWWLLQNFLQEDDI